MWGFVWAAGHYGERDVPLSGQHPASQEQVSSQIQLHIYVSLIDVTYMYHELYVWFF